MRTIDKLREITKCLRSNGFESAEKEAEILVRQGLDITVAEIYRDNPELGHDQIKTVDGMLERRSRHEPFQYIVGHEEFMGLKLMVGPGVLIPRPETEFMVEKAIKQLSALSSQLLVLDLCTGSGCLALTIAKEFPESRVFGADISEEAIKYAEKNAEINNINNATFLTGDLFEPIGEQFAFDVIISNPPYIKSKDIYTLQPEIKDWEPVAALDGGTDGLGVYRELIPAARRFLKDDGRIMLELGAGQAGSVIDIMETSGYKHIETIRDYAGVERIIQARCKR